MGVMLPPSALRSWHLHRGLLELMSDMLVMLVKPFCIAVDTDCIVE